MFAQVPLVLLLAAVSPPQITHAPVECMLADRHPQIDAAIEPAAEVEKARVYFHSGRTAEFHYVEMALQMGRFVARLPRPREKDGPVSYFVRAAGPSGAARRTPLISAVVVRRAEDCPAGGRLAETAPEGPTEVYSTTTSTERPRGWSGVSDVKRGEPQEPQAAPPRPPALPSPSPSTVAPPAGEEGRRPASREGKLAAEKKGSERKGRDAAETTQTVAVPPPAAAPAPPSRPAAPQEYTVGPNDILKITVYGHDDLSQVVVVQSDGTFTYPLIGQVKAVDLTPREMERKIATLLSQGFVRNPQVAVTVQEYRSKQVFVVGEVTRPGAYPLKGGNNSVVEMISNAGPLTPNAGAEVLVLRPRDPGTARPTLLADVEAGGAQADVIHVNLAEIQAGHLDRNIVLLPSDTVYVPQAAKVYVSGEVRNPGAFALVPGTTVRQLISLAGGFTDRASSGKLRVVRDTGRGKTHEEKIRMEDLVQPGDTIIVKEKLF